MEDKTLERAVVIEVQRDSCVCLHDGEEIVCELRLSESSELPTVGDEAVCERSGGAWYLRELLPRRSCFYRRAVDPNVVRRQPVAANFDYVFIVQALGHDFNLPRLERYLAAAWQSGGTPVVLLSKADTCPNAAECVVSAASVAVGAEVYAISAITGEGLDALAKYLTPESTLVLLGSSGVGKSTLVNALAGEELMTTGAVRESDERGRHTTTYRRMLFLPSGARIIDTPGMRTLGLTSTEGLGEVFDDVQRALDRGCRFRDCKHEGEPGCAITAAIADGSLDISRWERYKKLRDETERTERGLMRHQLFKERKAERRGRKNSRRTDDRWEDD